jgi:hypothetical protein
MPERIERRGQQHGSGERRGGIVQEGACVVGILMMLDGVEFDAESVFSIRTDVEGVFKRDGIKDGECRGESKEEKDEPANVDLTLSAVESIEPVHAERDG